jgi:hypothetical protein
MAFSVLAWYTVVLPILVSYIMVLLLYHSTFPSLVHHDSLPEMMETGE